MPRLLSSSCQFESLLPGKGFTVVPGSEVIVCQPPPENELRITWKDDESFFSRKPKVEYQELRCIMPIFTDELRRNIAQLLQKYRIQEEGSAYLLSFSPAMGQQLWDLLKDSPYFKRRRVKNLRTKSERLKAAFWVFNALPSAQSAAQAINQLACALHEVEIQAAADVRLLECTATITNTTFRPMRLSEPVKENFNGRIIDASYAIQHVILFRSDGAIQVQQLPALSQRLNYPLRSREPQVVVFEKAGSTLLKPLGFWESGVS